MTVEEVLKASGMTDEQIKALDAKVMGGFTQVLSTAAQEREKAELERRKVEDTFANEINPAITAWASDKAGLEAKVAAYESALKNAKESGFNVPEILNTPVKVNPDTVRNSDGRFVAAQPGATPGSPTYMTKEEGYRAVTSAQWFISEYMRLHNGAAPPEDMESLAIEAQTQRIPFRDFVAKKYDFSGKREKIKADEQKKHDDAIRAEAKATADKEWAEKMASGSPMTRQAEVSRFSEIRQGVKEGARPDPLKQTREQRHAATRQAIQKEIAENATVQ
jgi:hypothetical protein